MAQIRSVNEYSLKDVTECLSISEDPESNEDIEVKLMPNPSTGLFNLLVNKDPKIIVHIRIFDQSGRVIQQFKSMNNEVPIVLSEEASGIYIVECKVGNIVVHKKLIKS